MEDMFSMLTKRMKLSSGVNDAQLKILTTSLPISLPPDFISFLKFSNGAVGMIGNNYLEICKAEDIISLNEDYSVKLYAPGLILFGTDGGGEGYGFDYRGVDPIVVDIPFVGMSWNEARKKGDNFLEFLLNLSTMS
jgi:hypothetical protein